MKIIQVSPAVAATIPVALAFSLAAGLIWYLHLPQLSIAFFLGLIAGGLVDMDNHTSGRIHNIFLMLSGFTLSAVAMSLSHGHDILRPVLMSAIAFGSIWLGAVDSRHRTLAFGILTVAIYATLIEQAQIPWYESTFTMLAGAILYQLITLTYALLFPHRPVQNGLIASFATLGNIFQSKALYFDPDESPVLPHWQRKLNQQNQQLIQSFNLCRDALFVRLAENANITQQQLRTYFIAQDLHERVNSSHFDYEELTQQLEHSDLLYRIKDLILLQGEACLTMSQNLIRQEEYHFPAQLTRKTMGLLRSFAQQPHPEIQNLLDNLLAINQLLQKLATPANPAELTQIDRRIATPAPYSLRQAIASLRYHFSFHSNYFRHAMRIAVVTLPISFIIEYFALPLGYWILLTVVFVCQPNYAATKEKIKQRIIGTLLGVSVGSFLPLLIPSLVSKLAVIVVTCILFFYYRLQNYGYSTFFITVQVFIGLSIIGIKTAAAAPMRIVDTIIGAMISYAAISFLWPDHRYQNSKVSISAALITISDYLQTYIAQQGKERDNLPYRSARRRLYESATQLAQFGHDMAAQPGQNAATLARLRAVIDCNYRLLADLSALGAQRQLSLSDNAQRVIALLGEQFFDLTTLSPAEQQRQSAAIGALLADLPPTEKMTQRQLQRIAARENEFYQIVNAGKGINSAAG